ncbi:conserved hypothetical protein [Bacillus mycoides]|uniref:Uncharacterized protein n=1 Tax=Bacillus mycoides TaxID=1405 RepID=A0A654ATQ3_BACMY|nr:conserved hypothetical protein [Bacillus mycoides]
MNKYSKILFGWSPIHIIKIKVVQVGGRHLRVSFLYGVLTHAYQSNRTGCPKTIKIKFGAVKNTKFLFRGYFKILA